MCHGYDHNTDGSVVPAGVTKGAKIGRQP